MSETPQENAGAATVPGGEAETSSAGSPPSPPTQPETEVVGPGQNTAGGVVAVAPEPSANPGEKLGDNAPALADLQNQTCPNCTTGVLYVTRYDPHALHEAGQTIWTQNQPRALPEGWESGGAWDVQCFQCGWTHSFAMNPGEQYGKGRG